MLIKVMGRRVMIGRMQLLSVLGFVVAWATLSSSGFGDATALVLMGIIYIVLRFATKPLSRVIARMGFSIRWKFEICVVAIAGLFLVVSLIQIAAMNFMHDELGELANQINHTAVDLARLQEATLAEERALRERIIQVTTAQEEERRRISRDLHDGLGPSLAAVGNRLRACQRLVRSDPERAEGDLEEIANGLRGHVQEVRELIHDLRPLALDQLGLARAVEQQVSQFDQDTGIKASFTVDGDVGLNSFAEVTVFRVVQECLTNVQKHAKANQVDVRFQVNNSGLQATVKDNGKGFNADGVASGAVGKSMGLLSMRERAELLGGSLSIQSSPNRGSEITLFIPTMEV